MKRACKHPLLSLHRFSRKQSDRISAWVLALTLGNNLLRRHLLRWSIAAVCAAGISLSTLSAADIPVTTINDSGAGSLRAGLAAATSGDTLTFQTGLDGSTLVNGPTLSVTTAVTLHDQTAIAITDNHAYTIAGPLTINWDGTLALNGILSDGTSPGSLVKNGTGTLLLSGVNTYTGGTTTNGGSIRVLNSASLGTGTLTATDVVGSPTLQLGNAVTLTNKIALHTTLTVETVLGGTSQLSGVISGTNATDGLITTGPGTLTLSGVNTFAGGVHAANDSTLQVQNNASLGTGTLSNAGDLTLNLATGLVISNPVSLGNNLTVGVASGTATMSGPMTETAPSQFTKTGAGILVLSGTNNYTGGTIVSQGTLQGNSNSLVGNITNNGVLIFNQTTDATFAGDINGTGTLTKSGAGTLILSGTSGLTGTTTISQGGLQVMGALTGPINLTSDAGRLSGTGTVGNITNAGTVAPATSSIGTLTVNGTFTQTTGTTEIKFNSTGNVPNVNNDVLNVTGHATLGGTLKVLGVGGGTFLPGTQYTVITAGGGVSGQFSEARTDLPFFRVNVIYDPNDVVFSLQPTTSLAVAATTQNQLNVGTALDNIAQTSSGALFNMIGDLGVLPVDQQQQSLNQLNGEVFGNLQTQGLEIGSQFQQRVTNALVSNIGFLVGEGARPSTDTGIRGQSVSYGRPRTWTQGFGFGGNYRNDGNAGSLHFGQGGGIFGTELPEDDGLRIGVVGGSSYGRFSDSFGGGGQLSSYQLGAYSLIDGDSTYVLGSANYGYNKYYTHRDVVIGSDAQRLTAGFSGSQIGANIEAGLKLAAGSLRVQPLVGLQYLYLCQQGFEESGGPAALDVARSRANSLRASIGVRAAFDPIEGPGESLWTPFTHARLVGDMLDNDRIINASFSGAPIGGAFTSQGTRIGQVYGIVGEGLEVRVNETWSYLGAAEITAGDRTLIGTGSIGAVAIW